MGFSHNFAPPWPVGGVIPEGAVDRITRIDPRQGCFAMTNSAYFSQTIFGTMVVRVRTPALALPFNGVNIWTDSSAEGRVEATALPGYARARVEARLRVLDFTGARVIVETDPVFFAGSTIDIPVFYGAGFPFSGVAFADATITPRSTGPLIIEVRISSWAVAAGYATAHANINNACVTAIRVFSF